MKLVILGESWPEENATRSRPMCPTNFAQTAFSELRRALDAGSAWIFPKKGEILFKKSEILFASPARSVG
jgi:hypothetical protein